MRGTAHEQFGRRDARLVTWFRVQGSGFRVQGAGLRVEG